MSELITSFRRPVVLLTGGTGVGKTTAASYIESALGYPAEKYEGPILHAFCETFGVPASKVEYGSSLWGEYLNFRDVMMEAFGDDFWAKRMEHLILPHPDAVTVVEGDLDMDDVAAMRETYEVIARFHVVRGEGLYTSSDSAVIIQNPCPWPHSNKAAFFTPFMNEVLDVVCETLNVKRPKTAQEI